MDMFPVELQKSFKSPRYLSEITAVSWYQGHFLCEDGPSRDDLLNVRNLVTLRCLYIPTIDSYMTLLIALNLWCGSKDTIARESNIAPFFLKDAYLLYKNAM